MGARAGIAACTVVVVAFVACTGTATSVAQGGSPLGGPAATASPAGSPVVPSGVITVVPRVTASPGAVATVTQALDASTPDTVTPTETATPTTEATPTSSPTATATPMPTPTPVPTPFEGPIEPWNGTNRLNVLVVGVDKASHFEGNTDVMMVVSIDPTTRSMFLLSIPRDLCLRPCDTHATRLNEVALRQGMDGLKQEIRNLTGLNMHYWVMVNFVGVERIINQMGGVQVYVPRDFDERLVYLDTDDEMRLVLGAGLNTLNGREAVGYARSRKYDSGGDFARICRQQQVVRALKDQALSTNLLVNAPGILAALEGAFRTDFPFDAVGSLGRLVLDVSETRTHSWVLPNGEDYLHRVTGLDGAYLLQPEVPSIRDFVGDIVQRSTQDAQDDAFIHEGCADYF